MFVATLSESPFFVSLFYALNETGKFALPPDDEKRFHLNQKGFDPQKSKLGGSIQATTGRVSGFTTEVEPNFETEFLVWADDQHEPLHSRKFRFSPYFSLRVLLARDGIAKVAYNQDVSKLAVMRSSHENDTFVERKTTQGRLRIRAYFKSPNWNPNVWPDNPVPPTRNLVRPG